MLKDEGYPVLEIRKMTNHHDDSIRKWIHRFSQQGIDGVISKKHNHKQHKFTDEIEKKMADIASANPRTDYGLGFSTWSLWIMAGFLMHDLMMDRISHAEVRSILLKHGTRWRKSKTVLSKSNDPEYALKKSILNN